MASLVGVASLYGPVIVFVITMVATVRCFPDTAIGRRYILAKTGDGVYSLVPDGSHRPGISVTTKDIHFNAPEKPESPVKPKPMPIPREAPVAPSPPVSVPAKSPSPRVADLRVDKSRLKKEEKVVTLALTGHDGSNGRQGPKGPLGDSGPVGKPGAPGVKGIPGTCVNLQAPCDVNLIRKLAERITELEKKCSKPTVPSPLVGHQ